MQVRTLATRNGTTPGLFALRANRPSANSATGPLGHESHYLRHLAAFGDESAMNKGGWRISGERAKLLLRQQGPT